IPTLDVLSQGGELLLVMEYVEGESVSALLRKGPLPVSIACAIIHDILLGLHYAHEATDEAGSPLGIIHRDVSPQNVMVGAHGLARLLDFGIARARDSVHHSVTGELRGKIPYMAPEQLRSAPLHRSVDVYAAGVVLWEMITGRRLFEGTQMAAIHNVLNGA